MAVQLVTVILVQFLVGSFALALSVILFKRARGLLLQVQVPQTTPSAVFFYGYFKWFWTIIGFNWALTLLVVSVVVWIKPIWAIYGLLWILCSTLLSFPFCWIYFAIRAPRVSADNSKSKPQ